MQLIWTKNAWDEYLYWQSRDKAITKKINALIRDIARDPFSGIGKPEPLKHKYKEKWSRRIDEANRLIYTYKLDSEETIVIFQCAGHYEQ
jgi:toxin YoeB